MRTAIEDLRLSGLGIVHAGSESYVLREKIHAVAASRLTEELEPPR